MTVTALGTYDITPVAVTAAVFGLVLGSFLNVVICRLPNGLRSFFNTTFSRCPHCDCRICWYENIPVLSWLLLLRGRCRNCRAKISIQYPLVELITAIAALCLVLKDGPSLTFLSDLTLCALLITAAMIDTNRLQVPDSILVTGIILGVLFALVTPLPGWRSAVIGILSGFFIPLIFISLYEVVRGKTLMGGGDIKLLGMIGAFLGWKPLGAVIFYASFSGCIFTLLMLLRGRGTKIPFAPFLAAGSILLVFYPQAITL